MHFEIRHQISELEEEIYFFEVYSDLIIYRAFYLSERTSPNEPFGYDWETYYAKDMNLELDALEKKFGYSIHEWGDPNNHLIKEVEDKYNPVVHGLLSGICSGNVAKQHPLKISEQDIKIALIKKITQMKVR